MKVFAQNSTEPGQTHTKRGLCCTRGSASNVTLRIVNVVLLCVACVMGIYSLYQHRQRAIVGGHEIDVALNIPMRSAKRIKPTIRTIQPLSFYTGDLEKRDLFQAPWELDKPELPPPEAPPVENAQMIAEFSQGIRLVGIISDDDPKVVVEDLRSRTTIIMSEGDELKDAILHKIYGEYAVFKLGDELIELYP